jgi:hypothetical protein
VQQLKRLHVREKETLPLNLQKEVQLQGEESVLPVRRKAEPREKAAPREKAEPRNAAEPRRKAEPRNAAAARRKAALRENEKDKQSLTLISPFLFF